MKMIEIIWNNGTKSEIRSGSKMTKTAILGYIKDALETGDAKEIRIKEED